MGKWVREYIKPTLEVKAIESANHPLAFCFRTSSRRGHWQGRWSATTRCGRRPTPPSSTTRRALSSSSSGDGTAQCQHYYGKARVQCITMQSRLIFLWLWFVLKELTSKHFVQQVEEIKMQTPNEGPCIYLVFNFRNRVLWVTIIGTGCTTQLPGICLAYCMPQPLWWSVQDRVLIPLLTSYFWMQLKTRTLHTKKETKRQTVVVFHAKVSYRRILG